MTEEYLPVKPSQIFFFKTIPLYHRAKDDEFALYKKKGDYLNKDRIKNSRYPELFFPAEEKNAALQELTSALNTDLEKSIAAGGLVKIKEAMCNIVEEALTPDQEEAMTALPETVDILLGASGKDLEALENLTQIAGNSKITVEHTVNVVALTLQFCFFLKLPEAEVKQLMLAALLHDVGTSKIDPKIIEKQQRLTESEFKAYTDHSLYGHQMITSCTESDPMVPAVALEHHERLDGSGYPNQVTDISWNSQLIGFIDSYEALTYRGKAFRKTKKPYDSLKLMKQEVLKGKYSKKIFKQFTSCLVR